MKSLLAENIINLIEMHSSLHVLITNEVIINKKIYIFKRKYQINKHIWNITTEIEKID